MRAWIQTANGRVFDLEDPQPDMVHLDDIAHSLSRQCRYTGHSSRHTSVAEHSVLVARLCPPELRKQGLLHDAHEAFTGDVASPIKVVLGEAWRQFEGRIEAVVRERFGLPAALDKLVKEADFDAMRIERPSVMATPPEKWWLGDTMDRWEYDGRRSLRHRVGRSPEEAGDLFMAWCQALGVS